MEKTPKRNRKRFNPAAQICSSENVHASMHAHRRELEANHVKIKDYFDSLPKVEIVKHPHYTEVKIFDTWKKLIKPVEFYIKLGFTKNRFR